MNKVKRLALIVSVFGFYSSINANITGRVKLDTTKWAPVAYLSIIPDFSQMNTISFSKIIERSSISEDGVFQFQTKLLPVENHLYRIHISKNGDPPASLIIGGKNHNHFFLFAKRNIEIRVYSDSDCSLFQNLIMEGYSYNNSLQEINKLKSQLESYDDFGTQINYDFLRNSVFNEMRYFADTCTLPLVSLYAICQSNYQTDYLIQPDFYLDYLDKWSSEESPYFNSFRKQLNYESGTNWKTSAFIILTFLIVLVFFVLYLIRSKNKYKPLSKLTLQERRIYTLLKESKSNKEIADKLNISLSTVKSHVNSVYSKLGVKSRKEILDHNINNR
jgi:DNA-binding CsgD family transcriptional regulator